MRDWRALDARLPDDVVLKVASEVTAATTAEERFVRPVVLADDPFVAACHQVDWVNVTPITYVVDVHGTIPCGLRGRREPAAR